MDFREVDIPLHGHLGIVVEAEGSPSRITMELGEHVRGAVAPIHGGVLATLLDIACGAALGSEGYDPSTTVPVSTELSVRFLAQPRLSPLVTTAWVVERGEEIRVEGQVVDGGGYPIARGVGTYRLITGFGTHGKT